MPVFHENQIRTAEQIIHDFPENRFSVLLAQMQSGKTGTYLYVALECVKRELVDRVVILCGSSDTSLRAQLNQDLDVARETYLQETDPDGNLPRRLTDKFADINVFFSQDLKDIREITERTLIIHDESHMAQSKNNVPYKRFYNENGLSGALLGDFRAIAEKDIYILGISATPFSEIVSNKKVEMDTWTAEERGIIQQEGIELGVKRFHFMTPGADYIGVTDLLRCGAIQFTADPIASDGCERIGEILREGKAKYDKKYLVIRTHCAEKDADVMRTLASSNGYDYRSVFGQAKQGQAQGQGTKPKQAKQGQAQSQVKAKDAQGLEFMEEAPFRGCVIHICGRFRMGQVVPKQHIAMVYEQSKKPNADTILQGLVGRMCGYRAGGAHTDVDIFVSPMAEALIEKYAKAWSTGDMDVLSEVTKALNLGGTRRRNGGTIVSCKDWGEKKYIATVPIEFSCRHLERDNGEVEVKKFRQITASDLVNMFDDHPELIDDNPDKDEILRILRNIRPPGGRKRGEAEFREPHHHQAFLNQEAKAKSEKYYAQLTNAVGKKKRMNITSYARDALRDKMNTTKFERATLSIYGSCANADNTSGKCYLMGYVLYNAEIHPPESVEIAAVDPKCNYIPGTVNMEDDSVLDNVNGGQFITFSLDTADDPSLLRAALSAAILRTVPEHDTFIPSASRSINSLYDKAIGGYEGIRLKRSIYTSETIQNIIDSLEREHSVKLTLKKSRGRQPKDYHKYASISW